MDVILISGYLIGAHALKAIRLLVGIGFLTALLGNILLRRLHASAYLNLVGDGVLPASTWHAIAVCACIITLLLVKSLKLIVLQGP
jgi:hypothetical protein